MHNQIRLFPPYRLFQRIRLLDFPALVLKVLQKTVRTDPQSLNDWDSSLRLEKKDF